MSTHGWIKQKNEEDLICQRCGKKLTVSELEAMHSRDDRMEALYGETCEDFRASGTPTTQTA